jgi:hypothetical protein
VDRDQVVVTTVNRVSRQVALQDVDERIGLAYRPGGIHQVGNLQHFVIPCPFEGLFQQLPGIER